MPGRGGDEALRKRVESELYDQRLAEEEEDYEAGHAPTPNPLWQGTSARAKRVELATYQRFLELRREAIRDELEFDETELRQQALAEVTANPLSEEAERQFVEWTPTSVAEACPKGALESVVQRAVLILPHALWYFGYLARQTRLGQGYDAARKCVAATFLVMAFSRGRPDVWQSRLSFVGDALRCWAWEYPEDDVRPVPSRQNFYPALHTMLEHANVPVVQELMVRSYMRLINQTRGVDRRGRPVPRHPKAGLALVADGSFVEEHFPQFKPPEGQEGRIIVVGTGRDKVAYVTYADNGRFRKKVMGRRLVVLMCLATGLPVIAELASARDYEPEVVLRLLRRLFELAPDFPPVKYLLGDRLYGHSKQFCRDLVFSAGIHPVFPYRADYPDRWGKCVPHCDCQAGPEEDAKTEAEQERRKERLIPMEVYGLGGRFWTQEKRMASLEAAARAQPGPNGTRVVPRWQEGNAEERRVRLEYRCPSCRRKTKGRAGAMWDDPRVVTFLPHKGTTGRAALRTGLLLRRNAVESLFAALQRLGLAGRGLERPGWCREDDELELLTLSGLLFLTLRRYAFESGLYDYALRESALLGLLDPLTLLRPSPQTAPDALWAARARRMEVLLTSEGAAVPDDELASIDEAGLLDREQVARRLAQLLGLTGGRPAVRRLLPAIGDPDGNDVEIAALPKPPPMWSVANRGQIWALPFGSVPPADPPPGDSTAASRLG
jgi:hypothetical protein